MVGEAEQGRAPSPRVTVIMATYNWSAVLPHSIGSALRQTYRDFELLVVGDHCTDDSEEVVRRIAARDPRVRWINLPENAGNQFGPNNEGLRQARGEYIAYLSHDDLWMPHHLAVAVAAMDGGAAMCYAVAAGFRTEGAAPTPDPRRSALYIPPTCVLHAKHVTDQLGGWKDYRALPRGVYPDQDLWARMRAEGFELTPLSRVTAIKLLAMTRANVYRDQPSHEQAYWAQRIQTEPDLEPVLAVEMIRELERRMARIEPPPPRQSRARTLLRRAKQSVLETLGLRPPRPDVEAMRKHKGLGATAQGGSPDPQ